MTALLYGILGWVRSRREQEVQTLAEHREQVRHPSPPTDPPTPNLAAF